MYMYNIIIIILWNAQALYIKQRNRNINFITMHNININKLIISFTACELLNMSTVKSNIIQKHLILSSTVVLMFPLY